MRKLTVIILGAGNRGAEYARVMASMPEKYQVVGVAEPVAGRRAYIQEMFSLPDEACFEHWRDILAQPKMADLAIIATLEADHRPSALQALDLGYELLLEKPVAQNPQDCADVALAAKEKDARVLVCHVLRYTPFFRKVKEILMEGTIGEPVSVLHTEAVGFVHISHSYVRGFFHVEKVASPMLMAKSCHDLDIIQWLLDKPCKKVSSFGSLKHFKKENAPEGAPVRCMDGNCPVEKTCPYNCMKIYYEDKTNVWLRNSVTKGIAAGAVSTDEEVLQGLRTTNFGQCVYHSDNDVVDHQVVNMEFEGGATATFTMTGFSQGGRYIRIFGTKGELYASAADDEILVYTFADGVRHKIPVEVVDESILGGHGGGDMGMIQEMYEYFGPDYQGFSAGDIDISVKNHLIGFAAEEARHTGRVIDLDEYFARFGFEKE